MSVNALLRVAKVTNIHLPTTTTPRTCSLLTSNITPFLPRPPLPPHKVAKQHLRPHLSGLVVALLEGMSTLEPQVFSYVMPFRSLPSLFPKPLSGTFPELSPHSPLSPSLLLPFYSKVHDIPHIIHKRVGGAVGAPSPHSSEQLTSERSTATVFGSGG